MITPSTNYDAQCVAVFERARSGEIGYLEAHEQVRALWAVEEIRISDSLTGISYELAVKVDSASRFVATISRRADGRVVERYRSTSTSGRDAAVRTALDKFNQTRGSVM